MKKNKMLRMASALLVLTLLTTSVIGGTFAKYTTTAKANDTARVAKWGVVITASGSLYSNAYAKENVADGKGNLPAAWTTDGNTLANSISVAAATEEDNIVAPGTKSYGDGLSFGISGTPEVAVTVDTTIKAEDIFLKAGTYGKLVSLTVSDTEDLKQVLQKYNSTGVYEISNNGSYIKVDDDATCDKPKTYYALTAKVTVDDYFPVKYALEGTTKADDLTAVEVAEILAAAVEGTTASPNSSYQCEKKLSNNYDANTNLANNGPKFGGENLKWKWVYEADGDEDTKKSTNAKDTILGDLIAARGAMVDYVVVSVDGGKVTPLVISTADEDYTVECDGDVVANLQTKFDITLTVTQVD